MGEQLKKDCPHIVIGTPGRTKQLVNDGDMKLDGLQHFILDECDKCLEKADMRGDVQEIFMKTPKKKQVMMFSATLAADIRTVCRKFMQDPHEIFIDDESKLTLHGLLQYFVKLQESEKNRKLNDLLDSLEFKQFKDFQKRIMVSTDLFGRGIDIERVNIVINYDAPDASDTYLHRVGRAGRFGTKGLAISFISSEDDTKVLNSVQERFEVSIGTLPDQIDVASYINA